MAVSSHSSMQYMKSLFLVLKLHSEAVLYSFQIDATNGMIMTPHDGGGVDPIQRFEIDDDDIHDPTMIFPRPIECERLCGSSRLYFLFNRGLYEPKPLPPPPQGIIYDTSTKSYVSSFALPAEKPYGPLISAYGKLYHFTDPLSYSFIPSQSFQSYDPSADRWETLPPCPFYCEQWNTLITIGHAVCSGCILFSFMSASNIDSNLIVFHIDGNKWHKVIITNDITHYPFEGKAVVLNDVIHTVAKFTMNVIVMCKLRIESSMDSTGTNAYSFFLDTLATLELAVVPPPTPFQSLFTRYLTFIGENMFCLFKTARIYDGDLTYVCATTFQIAFGEDFSVNLTTLHSIVIKLYHPGNSDANISLCFTPDCGDTETIENKQVMWPECTKSTIRTARDEVEVQGREGLTCNLTDTVPSHGGGKTTMALKEAVSRYCVEQNV